MRRVLRIRKTLVLLGLKGGAHRIGAGGGVVGANGDLIRCAMALALVVMAVLYVTGNTAVYVTATALLLMHFHIVISPFE